MRKSFAFIVTFGVFTPLLAVGACTTNGGTVAKGGPCTQSIDCQEKLVCIYPVGADGGTGTCTDDLTGIVSVPDAASNDAPVPDAVVNDSPVADQVVQDNNVPDTSNQDTGTTDAAGD